MTVTQTLLFISIERLFWWVTLTSVHWLFFLFRSRFYCHLKRLFPMPYIDPPPKMFFKSNFGKKNPKITAFGWGSRFSVTQNYCFLLFFLMSLDFQSKRRIIFLSMFFFTFCQKDIFFTGVLFRLLYFRFSSFLIITFESSFSLRDQCSWISWITLAHGFISQRTYTHSYFQYLSKLSWLQYQQKFWPPTNIDHHVKRWFHSVLK